MCIRDSPYTEANGFVITEVAVSRGDQVGIVQLCAGMSVPCVIYEGDSIPSEDSETIAALEKENAELRERIIELEADKTVLENRVALRDAELAAANEKIANAQAALA